MIKIKVLFFGITTDLIGKNQLEMELVENTGVAQFKTHLKGCFPQLQNLHSYAIAVNEAYATDEVVIQNGDVVAVIPPVSGG